MSDNRDKLKNLYYIQDGDRPMYVVASSWVSAIDLWKAKIAVENDQTIGEVDEPQGVQMVCDGDEFLTEGIMTPLEKFIDESSKVCEQILGYCNKCGYAGPCEETGMGLMHDGCQCAAARLPRSQTQDLLTTALQHLREVMQENAELRQRIADMQDEQRNPPTLRTVCEKYVGTTDIDYRIGPNESLIPKEPKP